MIENSDEEKNELVPENDDSNEIDNKKSEEALEAAEMLNESSIAGLKDWDNFINMYGNQKIVGN